MALETTAVISGVTSGAITVMYSTVNIHTHKNNVSTNTALSRLVMFAISKTGFPNINNYFCQSCSKQALHTYKCSIISEV